MAKNFFGVHLGEIGDITSTTLEKEPVLPGRTARGDGDTRSRLTEGSPRKVLDLMAEYQDSEPSMSDVVQEASIVPMLVAVEYDISEEWESLLERRAKEGVGLILKEQKAEHEIEESMAARMNVLQTVPQTLAAKLDREVLVEELVTKVKMTGDEIKDIIKPTLNVITAHGEEQADPVNGGGDQALGHNPVRGG